MLATPKPAQADASRCDGASSRGPATPEGKARSSMNATSHSLHGSFRLLPHEDAAFDRLLAGLRARHAPVDEAEAHWVEEVAFAMWRQRRLRALEAAALAHAEGGTNEPEEPASRLPSLATLTRYRARVERDLRLAEERLAAAKRERPRLPASLDQASASRLRWLAERVEEKAAAATAANDDGTNGPDAVVGTNGPKLPPVIPNRAERRRLAALARKAGRAAA